MMHQKPADVCQVERAWWAYLCHQARTELALNEGHGAVATLSEGRAG